VSNNVENGTSTARCFTHHWPDSEKRRPDVFIPILCSVLPVSAPSDNDWAHGEGSQLAFEIPTLSETARPVIAAHPP
jgi:hypothetical protein